ncbi:MAG: winged helix-turn-helix transcriptional regulator [Desulfobacteraceae bacterium]|nr:MAG: winged helix-turn-helix transcriptional regulator [Desulfobacteraceae bacterium]
MDQQELRTLRILEEIEKDQSAGQRELAQKLNVSLGLVNSFIKRLVHKGYFKVTMIPRNRIKYILTPKGFAEKSRLTYEYFRYSYRLYKDARSKFKKLFSDFSEKGIHRIVFYGVSDLSEIAYLSLQETNIQMIAIVDEERLGDHFFQTIVKDPIILQTLSFDKIIITSDELVGETIKKLTGYNIDPEKIEPLF